MVERMPPFAPLELSDDDHDLLRQTAQTFLLDGIREYQQYCGTRAQGSVEPPIKHWKMVGHKHDVRIYSARHSGAKDSPARGTLLGVGSVRGSVFDCIYAACAPTVQHEHIKAAYTRDAMPDCAVLAELEQPSAEHPFRSMKIRWYVKAMRFPFNVVMRDRDAVFVDMTGLTLLADGECLAFQLEHSIDLPSQSAKYHRVNLSTITIWRQRTPTTTEIYIKTYLDMDEPAMLMHGAIHDVARSLLMVVDYARVGKMKTLAWMLCRKSLTQSTDQRLTRRRSELCNGCSSSVTASERKACALCSRAVCGMCRVKKKIFVIPSKLQVRGVNIRLCPSCWYEVEQADALDIAADEAKYMSTNLRGDRFSALAPRLQSVATSSTDGERSDQSYVMDS